MVDRLEAAGSPWVRHAIKWTCPGFDPGDLSVYFSRMNIINDTREYRRLLKENESVSLPFYMPGELSSLPAKSYIVTGEKTDDFGGGQSPFGFVVLDGSVLARATLPEASASKPRDSRP